MGKISNDFNIQNNWKSQTEIGNIFEILDWKSKISKIKWDKFSQIGSGIVALLTK